MSFNCVCAACHADALNKSDGLLFRLQFWGFKLFESGNGPVQRDCRGST